MTTYLAVSEDARTTQISAYTRSDAYQQAAEWAGDFGLKSFNEI